MSMHIVKCDEWAHTWTTRERNDGVRRESVDVVTPAVSIAVEEPNRLKYTRLSTRKRPVPSPVMVPACASTEKHE